MRLFSRAVVCLIPERARKQESSYGVGGSQAFYLFMLQNTAWWILMIKATEMDGMRGRVYHLGHYKIRPPGRDPSMPALLFFVENSRQVQDPQSYQDSLMLS